MRRRLNLVEHWPLVVAEAVWLLFAVNFNRGFVWGGDAQVPFTFLRRLFGANVHAVGYQFGLAFFEAPWFAIGKLAASFGVHTVRTHPTTEAAVALGAIAYVGLSVGLVYVLLRRLRLRHAGLAAGLTLFGTPLFFYGTFSPAQTHAVDTFLSTVLVVLVLSGFRRDWPISLCVAAGAVSGAAASVRWFDAALGIGVWLTLVAYRRYRAALIVGVAGAVVLGTLVAVPEALGVPPFGGGYNATRLEWSPMSPLDMLFTIHRGLFIWTPVAALGVVGLVLAARRGGTDKQFVVAVWVMAASVVVSQLLVPFWDAGWSFSQRYFTALFPLLAIGVAELLERWPRPTATLAVAGVGWSVFLCLTMVTLPFPSSGSGGAQTLVRLAGTQSFGAYANGVYRISHLRVLVPFDPFHDHTVPSASVSTGLPHRNSARPGAQ